MERLFDQFRLMRVFIVVSFHSAREAFHRLPVEKVFIFFFLSSSSLVSTSSPCILSSVLLSVVLPLFSSSSSFLSFRRRFFWAASFDVLLPDVLPSGGGRSRRPDVVFIISLHHLLLRVFVLLERSSSTPLDAFSGFNTANRRDTGATQPHVSRSSSPVSVFDPMPGGRLLCSPLFLNARRRRRLFGWKEAFVFVFSLTRRLILFRRLWWWCVWSLPGSR